jgi:hypothetical protein
MSFLLQFTVSPFARKDRELIFFPANTGLGRRSLDRAAVRKKFLES